MNRKSLINGPIFSSMSLFAIPLLLGNLLQQLYTIIDTWIVGRYLGAGALASVGASFALMVFLTSVLIGLCMGSGVVFSYDYGEGAYTRLERRIGTAFLGILTATGCITILSLALLPHILHWVQIPAELDQMTAEYLHIVLLGIPAVFLYNFFAGYLRALGNSLLPLLILTAATFTNIGLDFLFVLHFHMGIRGVALATVIAQHESGLLLMLYCMFRDRHIQRACIGMHIVSEDLRILGRYSLYTCLQQSVMNLGILMVQGIVNSFGVTVMAAFSAGVKIDAFAYMPAQEYGNAFSTFIAQNHGAGRMDRVRKGIRIGFLTSIVYCIAASIVLCVFAPALMQVFLDAGEVEAVAIGTGYLQIEGAFYVGIGILFLWYGLFRAIGKPQVSLILTILSLGTRVVLAYLSAATAIGYAGIWWAIPIGWALADLTGVILWRKLKHC
ncbi:MAG: MATE family efflux transporter [Eubacteriales bacterium]|nr:MATE family efflux transporter [Eubacteriales bacterium]